MNEGSKGPRGASDATALTKPAVMSSDQSTQGAPGADTKSPREPLQQLSCLPADLPAADPLLESMVTFQPGRSKLELMPGELLVVIVEALAPDFALKYTKCYQAYRANLRNLCLVSRRMDVLARPALYSDLRLYSYSRLVRLSATLFAYPRLTSHIKSILFFPYHESELWHISTRITFSYQYPQQDICTIDLRPLRFLQDPDFAYWTRGSTEGKVSLPQTTRDELAYNLLFKILSRSPALEALYLRLLEFRPPLSQDFQRANADAHFIHQAHLQAQLFDGFCGEPSILKFPKLKKLGMLGGEDQSYPFERLVSLFESLLGSPNLHELFWTQFDLNNRGRRAPFIWQDPMTDWDYDGLGLTTSEVPRRLMSRSVKRIKLGCQSYDTHNCLGFATAFPSLESLTVDDKCCFYDEPSDRNALDGHSMFQYLGRLENFHTFEFDCEPNRFQVDITTASGPSKLIRLSAMSKLHTLVVPVDFFVKFALGEDRLVERTTVLLPDSLRHLTLLLNTSCEGRLAEQCGMLRPHVLRKVGQYLREEAHALLVDFPHLEKIDLCYHMGQYRRDKVHTLAARSTS